MCVCVCVGGKERGGNEEMKQKPDGIVNTKEIMCVCVCVCGGGGGGNCFLAVY